MTADNSPLVRPAGRPKASGAQGVASSRKGEEFELVRETSDKSYEARSSPIAEERNRSPLA